MTTVSDSRRQSLSFQKEQAGATKSIGNYDILETIGEGQYGKHERGKENPSEKIFFFFFFFFSSSFSYLFFVSQPKCER
jgi:hypothetical protein